MGSINLSCPGNITTAVDVVSRSGYEVCEVAFYFSYYPYGQMGSKTETTLTFFPTGNNVYHQWFKKKKKNDIQPLLDSCQ